MNDSFDSDEVLQSQVDQFQADVYLRGPNGSLLRRRAERSNTGLLARMWTEPRRGASATLCNSVFNDKTGKMISPFLVHLLTCKYSYEHTHSLTHSLITLITQVNIVLLIVMVMFIDLFWQKINITLFDHQLLP